MGQSSGPKCDVITYDTHEGTVRWYAVRNPTPRKRKSSTTPWDVDGARILAADRKRSRRRSRNIDLLP